MTARDAEYPMREILGISHFHTFLVIAPCEQLLSQALSAIFAGENPGDIEARQNLQL